MLFRSLAVAATFAFTFVLAQIPALSVAAKSTQAPPQYRVDFETSRGPFVVEVKRDLAPRGADRFYELVKAKHFDGARFYRVVPGFVVQWGYAADPAASKLWDRQILDDPPKTSNTRGTIAFAATAAPNSRSQEVFINYADNSRLDGLGFAPFGTVVSGMDAVDHIYSGDGEAPDQGQIFTLGNAYLAKNFPKLDYIKSARIER